MIWYKLLALFAIGICFLLLLFHFIRLIKLGAPKDYARKKGNTGQGIAYSMTKAMSPVQKESAYMHLPTYSAGMVYHLGTFLSFAILVLSFFYVNWPSGVIVFFTVYLALSFLAGIFILVKRIVKEQLRLLSNPDDYISNILVTLFQLFTIGIFWIQALYPYYFIIVSILFIYLPAGKLKHLLYFFAARYHLGFFYGWRDVWPPKTIKYLNKK